MNSFTFTFGGINSANYDIHATSYDFFNPPKRENRKEIDFRHGSYVYDHEIYSDRHLQLNCFWLKQKTRKEIREITLWLSRRGQLVLDIDSGVHYIASLYESTDLEAIWQRGQILNNVALYGRFALKFRCFPFAISPQTTIPLSHGANDIDYQGTAGTPTNIIIRNTGTTPIHGVTITAVGMRRTT